MGEAFAKASHNISAKKKLFLVEKRAELLQFYNILTKNIGVYEIFTFGIRNASHNISTKNIGVFEILTFEILTIRDLMTS